MYLPIWLDKPPVQAIKRMKQFIAFVIKETKHILRDKRTMLILFGMPVVMMLLFGFAITTDVKNVRTVHHRCEECAHGGGHLRDVAPYAAGR